MRPRPNILWLMTDEQRKDSLGCYGSTWASTPSLDALAGNGAVFSNAITPAPVCVPARASILTGRYPHETGVWWNDPKHGRQLAHLTHYFEAVGYETASFGKQHYLSPNQAFQLERDLVLSSHVGYFEYSQKHLERSHKVLKYPGRPYPWIFGGEFPGPAGDRSEAIAVAEALAWLRTGSHEPFLLRLSFNAPHTPVTPPRAFASATATAPIAIAPESETLPDSAPAWISNSLLPFATSSIMSRQQIEKMRRYYYAEVAFVDDQFGRLLGEMEKGGFLENTIIAFTSDHGTHLGDFGLVQKQTFYEPVVTVPFFFVWKGVIPSGLRLDTPVETRQLLPTLLELAGVPFHPVLQKDSLARVVLGDNPATPRPVFSAFTLGSFGICHDKRLMMVREGPWKLTLSPDSDLSDCVLTNLEEDPFERNNLFDSASEIGAALKSAAERHLSIRRFK